MATNIKITYTTDLEEIPSEVSRILSTALGKLEEATSDLFSTASALEDNEAVIPEKLDEIKTFLEIGVKALNRIDEMYAILASFHQLKTNPEQPQVAPPKQELSKVDRESFSDS